MPKRWTQVDQIKVEHTSKKGCDECLKTGDAWVHLRLCLTLRPRWMLRL